MQDSFAVKRMTGITMVLKSIKKTEKLLPEQVSEQIINLITQKQLKAGEKLPNEFELAEKLAVGRGTIREAIIILVSKNVVEIRRGCGTFVCSRPGMVDDPLGFAFIRDKKKLALDLCEVRLMIEPEIAALAARRAEEHEIKELQKLADEVAELCKNQEQHMEKDIEFHEWIAKLSKNAVVSNLVPVIQQGIAVFIQVTDRALAMETVRTHQKIVDAIRDGDETKARDAMLEHLTINRDLIHEMGLPQ